MTMLFAALLLLPHPDPPPLLHERPAAGWTVDETVASPSGFQGATVLAKGGKKILLSLFEGKEIAEHDEIDQATLLDSGELVYWYKEKRGEFVVSPAGRAGPYASILMPDIRVLDRLGRPTAAEWSYRGGTRTSFGVREQPGEWTAILRYTAEAEVQEKHPLPTTRQVMLGPDPMNSESRPIRYGLLRGAQPIFIGQRDEEEECLVVGTKPLECGEAVVMVAYSGASGRAAVAVKRRKGLFVNTGSGLIGPVSALDWVAFSPDGNHLALVVNEKGQRAIMVDDKSVFKGETIDSLAWTGDNRLLFLHHDSKGSHLHVGDGAVLDKLQIQQLYLSPDDRWFAVGLDQSGVFVLPFDGLRGLDTVWSGGFLKDGRFFARAKSNDGQAALLFDGRLSAPCNGIASLNLAPDGLSFAAVASSVQSDSVLFETGDPVDVSGRVLRVDWCRGNAPLVRVRRPDGECLLSRQGTGPCCPRIVAAGCTADEEPLLLCLASEGYVMMKGSQPAGAAFTEVPPQLLYQDSLRGTLAFAARRQTEWFLVFQGAESPAGGTPEFLYPADDGPWFQVAGTSGRRWATPRATSGWFDSVGAPFVLADRTVFKARKGGKETWAHALGTEEWHDQLLSPPIPVPYGFWYWARSDGTLKLIPVGHAPAS
jgi:hypothetical protein